MDGEGLEIAHNGVRVDDDVDPFPGLSGITVAEQGRDESSRLDVLAPIDRDWALELSRSCRNWSVP
jgi:hypothetical protein